MQQETSQKMLSPVRPGEPSVYSNWATLHNDLKKKSIFYLPPEACHQVLHLCKDADKSLVLTMFPNSLTTTSRIELLFAFKDCSQTIIDLVRTYVNLQMSKIDYL